MSKKKGLINYDSNVPVTVVDELKADKGRDYDIYPSGVSIYDYTAVDAGESDYYKRVQAMELAVKFIGVKGSAPQHPLIGTAQQIYDFLKGKDE